MHTWKWILVLTTLSWVACGGGGGDGGDPEPQPQNVPPVVVETDDDHLQIAIAGPSISGTLATSAAELTLEGRVSADVEVIEWKNLVTGASGNATRGAGTAGTALRVETDWSAPMPVGVGDNPIVVTAKRGTEETSAFLFVVRDAAAEGLSAPRLLPSGVLIPDPTSILLTVSLPMDLLATGAEGWKVEPDGTPIAKVTDLFDDGDAAHGDESPLDGTYSGRFEETATEPGTTLVRVKVLHAGGEVWSPPTTLRAAHPIDATAFAASLTVQDEARLRYEEAFASEGRDAAIAAALAVLKDSEHVKEVGRAGEDGGIWVVFEAGFLGGLLLSPEGTKGCGSNDICPPVPRADLDCLAPYELHFQQFTGGTDEAESIHQLLTAGECPPYDPAEYSPGPFSNLAQLRRTANRGVIVISSHGDNWYSGAGSIVMPLLGTLGKGDGIAAALGFLPNQSAPVVAIDEQVLPENLEDYMLDLVFGRLIVWGQIGTTAAKLAFTPGYVYEYFCLPDSMVYVASCRSAFNSRLADAFLAVGAKGFVGYDGYVDAAWSAQKGIQLFTDLRAGKTLGEAFVPGAGPRGVNVVLFGDERLRLPDSSIKNPSFEDGMEGWGGVASVETIFGEIEPPEATVCNDRMARIPIHGALSQEICIPDDATKITFQYDFVSQSLNEVCGFMGLVTIVEVTFTPDDATIPQQQWLYLTEETVCGTVAYVDAGFVDHGLDTDGTWHTGWLPQEADVSAIQGEKGLLEFKVVNPDPPMPAVLLVDDLIWTREE